jgi:hypothetical protein
MEESNDSNKKIEDKPTYSQEKIEYLKALIRLGKELERKSAIRRESRLNEATS